MVQPRWPANCPANGFPASIGPFAAAGTFQGLASEKARKPGSAVELEGGSTAVAAVRPITAAVSRHAWRCPRVRSTAPFDRRGAVALEGVGQVLRRSRRSAFSGGPNLAAPARKPAPQAECIVANTAGSVRASPVLGATGPEPRAILAL